MAFEFGNISVKAKKKELNINQKNPVIHVSDKGSKVQYCFVLDTYYPRSIVYPFLKWIDKNIRNNSYIVLVATTLDCKADELKQIVDFYSRNTIQIDDYLPDNFNNVIYMSVGRSIYTFTESDELSVETFYDFIFNKTFFFAPKVKSYVFPIDYLMLLFKEINGNWVPKDSSRMNFANLQIRKMVDIGLELSLDRDIPEINIHCLLDEKEIDRFLFNRKHSNAITAIDTETSGLDFVRDELGCITISSDESNAYFLDAKKINKNLFKEYAATKTIIGQNFKFDYKVLKHNGFICPLPYSDTMVLGQTLNEMRGNSLKALAYIYTKYGGYEKELDEFKKKYKVKSYLDIPFNVLYKYAAMDAVVTYIVHKEMQKQVDWIDQNFPVKDNGYTVRKFYEEVMMLGYKEFFELEYEGMYVDKNKCDEVSNAIIAEIAKNKSKIYELFKTNENLLNLDSAVQLGKFIEYELGWKCYGRTKTNVYATGEEQLVRWIKDGHTEAKLIQKVRSLSTILGMFVGTPGTNEGWREYLVKDDISDLYKMHPTFGVGATSSKRNNCQDPNLQQVPSHGIFAEEIRGVFTPPPSDEKGDYVFATLDYASLQIRLCAIDSNDSFLCNLYKTDLDPDLHSTTAYELIKDNDFNFIEIEQDGKKYEFFENEEISVIRDNQEIKILAKDIQIEDKLLDKK